MTRQSRLYIIAAMGENRVIGIKNRLPWHLPDEWKHFREVTNGKPFLMGRKSFEAPDALHSGYKNVILTSDPAGLSGENTAYAENLPAALTLLKDETEIFILGGATVFHEALPLVHGLYLTIVHASPEGDAFFPEVNWDEWTLRSSSYHEADHEHIYAFSMNLYIRKGAHEK